MPRARVDPQVQVLLPLGAMPSSTSSTPTSTTSSPDCGTKANTWAVALSPPGWRGRALFAQIQAQCYRGSYSAVTDYIRRWRVESASSPTKAFVPLSVELGEAFQFDWSDEAMVVGGVFYNVQVAHLKLCASRAFWLVAYPSQRYEMR